MGNTSETLSIFSTTFTAVATFTCPRSGTATVEFSGPPDVEVVVFPSLGATFVALILTGLGGLAVLGLAVPGIVLGVGLLSVVGAVDRIAAGVSGGGLLLGGTAVAVVYAYCVRFFAVAQHGLEASLKRISPSMDASARTLGAGQLEMLRRVHWPLLRPSIATAALLVFVDCLKELPATLVLRPFNVDTLAVIADNYARDERLSHAGWPSLMIVVLTLPAVIWLTRKITASRPGDPHGPG
jgi:iron(III) transport system permease protein